MKSNHRVIVQALRIGKSMNNNPMVTCKCGNSFIYRQVGYGVKSMWVADCECGGQAAACTLPKGAVSAISSRVN